VTGVQTCALPISETKLLSVPQLGGSIVTTLYEL